MYEANKDRTCNQNIFKHKIVVKAWVGLDSGRILLSEDITEQVD